MVLPYIKINPPQVYMCSPSWTLLPPPSPYHPSGSSQCTSPKLPVSCTEPGLVIHFLYDIIHVLMPFSQIIPPPQLLCLLLFSPILNPPPTSLPIPSLWVIPVHQPQASYILHQTWPGDSFLIWYYTCFNAILPNHPTLSLYHRVQKTVLYISVSFAVSYTGFIVTIFLNSIYMH